MRLLFVTPTPLDSPRGGRAMLAHLHRDVLQSLLGLSFAEHLLGHTAALHQRLTGHIDGATPQGSAEVIAAIDRHGAEALWLDGSNLGRIAQAVRRDRSNVRILTFCHNVEARFFLGALRRSPSPRATGIFLANLIAERLATRWTHDLIGLSERDSRLMRRVHGRSLTAILPMAMADQLTSPFPPKHPVAANAPFLFVGGAFYANQKGIAWFTRKVAPRVQAKIVVIGNGMEGMRTLLETAPNVRVLGSVRSLEPHYRTARAVIAPIFDGSGMKTKVAEALMFGKRVIGTDEAFSGYGAIASHAGWRCDTANGFVEAINGACAAAIEIFDPRLRRMYETEHSVEAAERRIAAILGIASPNKV